MSLTFLPSGGLSPAPFGAANYSDGPRWRHSFRRGQLYASTLPDDRVDPGEDWFPSARSPSTTSGSLGEVPLLRAWRGSRAASASSHRSSTVSTCTTVTAAGADDSFNSCVSHAFPISFLDDHRVRHYCTKVMIYPHAFVLVGRSAKEKSAAFYGRSKKLWEQMPLGQVRVFRATATSPPLAAPGSRSVGSPNSVEGGEDSVGSPYRLHSCFPAPPSPATLTIGNGSFDSTLLRPSTSAAQHLTLEGPPLVSLCGLRKFASSDDGSTFRAAFMVAKETPTHSYAMERIDGAGGVLSAFVYEGVPYWVVGSEDRHLILSLTVPEEDVALYTPPPAEHEAMRSGLEMDSQMQSKDGNAGSALEDTAPSSSSRNLSASAAPFGANGRDQVHLAQGIARLWGQLLCRRPLSAVQALHAHICAEKTTLCFAAVLEGWEGLVPYSLSESEAEYGAKTPAELPSPSSSSSSGDCRCVDEPNATSSSAPFGERGVPGHLKFFALTTEESSLKGICVPVTRAEHFFRAHDLPYVWPSECVPLGSKEFEVLEEAWMSRLRSAGAVFYGVNADGIVVRMWKSANVPLMLERAAQEWILTHRLEGCHFDDKMQRKISALPKRSRGAGRVWMTERHEFLSGFSTWLFDTQQLSVSSDARVVRLLKGRWISLQRTYEKVREALCLEGPSEDSVGSVSGHTTVFRTASTPDDFSSVGSNDRGSRKCAAPPDRSSKDEGRLPEVVLMTGPQGCGKSTLARVLVSLLMQCGQTPCWMNQDEMGGKPQFLAALRRTRQEGRYSHLIIDKMHLSVSSRSEYGSLCGLKAVTKIAWEHPSGAEGLLQVCCERVKVRRGNHRSFRCSNSFVSDGLHTMTESCSSLPAAGEGCSSPPSQSDTDCDEQVRPPRVSGVKSVKGTMTKRICDTGMKTESDPIAGASTTSERFMRRIVMRSVGQYDVLRQTGTSQSWVKLDISSSLSQQVAKVWQHLQLHSRGALRDLRDLNTQEACRLAFAYEDLLEEDCPQEAVLEAVSLGSVIQSLPENVWAFGDHKGRKKKCGECRVQLHNFVTNPNPVAFVQFAELRGRVVPLRFHRVIADAQATIVEAYSLEAEEPSCLEGSLPLPCCPSSPAGHRALLLCIAQTKRGSGQRYAKDLFRRAVETDRPDPFCMVTELPHHTTCEFRHNILTKPI